MNANGCSRPARRSPPNSGTSLSKIERRADNRASPQMGQRGMGWGIGVDRGGTFTGVALVDDASGHIGVAKVATTPSDLTEGVLCALDMAMRRYQVAAADVGLLSHATTVVTNAILEET